MYWCLDIGVNKQCNCTNSSTINPMSVFAFTNGHDGTCLWFVLSGAVSQIGQNGATVDNLERDELVRNVNVEVGNTSRSDACNWPRGEMKCYYYILEDRVWTAKINFHDNHTLRSCLDLLTSDSSSMGCTYMINHCTSLKVLRLSDVEVRRSGA